MRKLHMWVAVVGAAVVLLPAVLVAQIDPGTGAAASPAGPTGVGPQNGQPGTAGMTVPGQTNQPSSMRDSLGAPGQTGQEMLDKQFVRDAAEMGIADVKLGTLAVAKGSPAVKEMAQKLVDDHTAMNKDLDTVADSIGVMLPKKMNKDAQKEYDKLNGLASKDFDTEYVTYLVKVHFADLHNFHMEASATSNTELAQEVVRSLGMMHQHLSLITGVAKQEGIALPPKPPRPSATTASK